MQFKFSTLEDVRNDELIEVFNRAFAEYFVKVALDEVSLNIKVRTENIDLQKSVGAFFGKKLVGFILLGIENEIAFNGGTGVLKEFRGHSLTQRMYEFILPKLIAEDIVNHQLEVISKNLPAIKTYEKIGFQIARNLACFKCKFAVSRINQTVEIREISEIDETLFPTFWNSKPSWQNSLSAIKRTQNLHKILGAFHENNLVGYLIHTAKGRIKQFAVHADFRRQGIGQTLFAQLNKQEIVISNIDKADEETISFLEKLGLELFIEQFEMQMKVPPN